jgi:hypothetical protein
VTITNNGVAPTQFFVDARLNSTTSLSLQNADPPPSSAGYPLPLAAGEPEWYLPTQSSSITVAAAATLPIMFDYSPFPGDPDLVGAPGANNTAVGTYTPSGGKLEPGVWGAVPTELGPYPGPAPAGLVNVTATVTTKAFDPAVTTAGGDYWTAAFDLSVLQTFSPVTINPGESAVIQVTITPAGTSGTVVSGNLYIDAIEGAIPPYFVPSGDELAALPYTYTIQ